MRSLPHRRLVVVALTSVVHWSGWSSAPAVDEARGDRPWKCTIVDEREPGIPMILTGRVIDQDARPLANVKVYVYHTDTKGLYHLPGQDGFRLTGTVWTSEDGRFEFRTIRPGPYPGAASGEHFHFKLTEGGIADHFALIEFFEDQPVKLSVAVGKQGGSARYHQGFAWKPDESIRGQRLDVEFRVER